MSSATIRSPAVLKNALQNEVTDDDCVYWMPTDDLKQSRSTSNRSATMIGTAKVVASKRGMSSQVRFGPESRVNARRNSACQAESSITQFWITDQAVWRARRPRVSVASLAALVASCICLVNTDWPWLSITMPLWVSSARNSV